MMYDTDQKRYTEGADKYRIRARYGMDYEFARKASQAPHFSITAEINRLHGRRWMEDAGGMLHGEVAMHFPMLEPYLKWHLVSTDGPMHYLENAQYWWEKITGKSQWKTEPWDPNPVKAFKSTIVFGLLPNDRMPPKRASWSDVKQWLLDRLPPLMEHFYADMERLKVLEG